MSYSCSDFTDDILSALKIDVPEEAWDDPSAQADLALAEIERLQRLAAVWKVDETKQPPKRSYDVALYSTNRTVLTAGIYPARNRLHAVLAAMSALKWGRGSRVDIATIKVAKVKGAAL